ncbi:hypothetical protein Rhopal_005554-T1 [Rhodotorula paludigena]|uniref:Uncharacterized protein n=1 Tax=Rhodotorula paludigena TaxID=86838 RepID=A0AAV5GTF6_9BASI|nr:hypothetical protein Rhopal_005554-T1 [Rhodotorula paludigena]
MDSVVSLVKVSEPQFSQIKVKSTRARQNCDDCRPVPNVKPKALKKLKADLVNADKARAIVRDLKRMDVPLDEDGIGDASFAGDEKAESQPHRKVSRGYALSPFQTSADGATAKPAVVPPVGSGPALPLTALATPFPAVSPGALGGLAAARSGAFDLLANVTGVLVEKSGARDGGFTPPLDRVSVFVYWWGFELALPPPTLRTLSSVASVQSSFFTFLQAFVLAGGAPELAPFVRYISSYCDMEWTAIKAQNRGHGVVLAATWLLPVARSMGKKP